MFSHTERMNKTMPTDPRKYKEYMERNQAEIDYVSWSERIEDWVLGFIIGFIIGMVMV